MTDWRGNFNGRKYSTPFFIDIFHLVYNSSLTQPLVWDEVKEKIQEFREQYIDSSIIQTEISEQPMLKWLATLPLHNFSGSLEAALAPEEQLGTSQVRHFLFTFLPQST